MEQPINPMQPNQMAQQHVQQTNTPSSGNSSKNMILVLIIVLLLAAIGGLGYLYYTERQKAADPLATANEEAQLLKEKVGELILLPDEEPAIATIIDINKLKEQNPEFYANAENGDKLLVYSNKAILYDPEGDKILNVAPIIKPSNDAVENSDSTLDQTRPADGEESKN
jgi:flagellar basal body-associated protein FliL